MVTDNDMRNKWIERLFKGVATWDEQRKLAQSDDVELKMRHQWEASEESIADKDTEDRIWRKVEKRSVNKKRTETLRTVWRTVAAACVVLALLSGTYWLIGNRHTGGEVEDELCTFLAEQSRSYVLPDSSVVWMKAGSTIQYMKNFNSDRTVWLSGESVFEVKKREQSPFRVYMNMNPAFVEVKGTVFSVVANTAGRSEITLYSGSVEFNTSLNGRKVMMSQNQRIIYSADEEKVELKDIQKIDWSQGRYRFKDILMSDLLQSITDIYHVQVELAENVPLHYRFTGFIRYDETLTDVFGKICFNTDLKLKKQVNKYIIYK